MWNARVKVGDVHRFGYYPKLSHTYLLLLCMTSLVANGMPRGNGASSRDTAIHSIQTIHTAKARGRLHSRRNYILEILDNGTVQGTYNITSPYTVVELRTYNSSLKRIYGVKSGRFIAIKKSGRVHGSKRARNNSLLIEHHEQNDYFTYRFSSFKSNNSAQGFLAMKKKGHVMRADKTINISQEASNFLFVHIDNT